MYKQLWTFEDSEKLKSFTDILDKHAIEYEIQTKGSNANKKSPVDLAVDEAKYTKAKALLLKHRKRRTSSELN